jgi:hypothetical protein
MSRNPFVKPSRQSCNLPKGVLFVLSKWGILDLDSRSIK